MELQKELDFCYVKAARTTNTDNNEKLLSDFLVEYRCVPYCTVIVLPACLERNRCWSLPNSADTNVVSELLCSSSVWGGYEVEQFPTLR